jgi:two-component system, cell cycle sensor histidine kinase and response regulator CckA
MSGSARRARVLARPAVWLWAAVCLSILGVASVSAIHARQRQVLGRAFRTMDEVRAARVDLAEGYLHASLGGEEGPFDRAQGLARLDQATRALEAAAAELDDREPGAHGWAVRRFAEQVRAFRNGLGAWGAAGRREPAWETELRVSYLELERQADAFDGALVARMVGLSAHLDLLFQIALAVSMALVAAVCGAALVAARHQRASRRALELSESRLEALLDHLPDWVWLKDLQSRFVAVSAALARAVGRTRDGLQGLRDADLWPEAQAGAMVAGDQEALRAGGPVHVEERAGERWIDTLKAPVLDAAGRPLGTVGIARDVTERRRAEAERSRLEAQLAQAQRLESVGRLAGGVAHDFNNMLGVILGAADVIHASLPAEDPVQDAVLDLKEAALRSRGITRQLLTISRQQPTTPQALDVDAVIEASRGTLARLVGEDLQLRFRPGAGGWAVRVDPSQLDQLLMNLLVNAREAMPGGGEVEIETGRAELDAEACRAGLGAIPGPHVLLRVRDHGVGMDAETRAHLFEPFFTTKRPRGGTGLGLATVYGIVVQGHGGLRVATAPGEGSTFEIYLPRSLEAPPAAVAGAAAGREEGRFVLLVEDDASVRRTTTRMLEQLGHRVAVADSAAEAFHLFERDGARFDLLITDVVMPAMGGPELRRALADLRPGLRTVFVSGWAPEVAMQRAGLEPGVLFLQKPFTLEELARAMRQALA